MKKNIFFSKKINSFYFFSLFFFITLIIIYFVGFYIQTTKPFFIMSSSIENYYIIPKDKEGEKVNFLEKKSINNLSYLNNNNNLDNIDNLIFTIQLFSNANIDKVKKYKKKFINLKTEIIDISDLYLFKIETEIGINYFLSYKNFLSLEDAKKFCNINSFLNECLIIYLENE